MPATDFFPQPTYAASEKVPRVLVAPPRYIQGSGVLGSVGRYLTIINIKRAVVYASARGLAEQGPLLRSSLQDAQISSMDCRFPGECSLEAIDAAVATLAAEQVDCLIAVGGGKCVDAGKCVAYRLGVPVVVVPTLASNDAPCSAVSVVYTPAGVVSAAEFFPDHPAFVIVDTEVVAAAAERYLVAGMGDAMATWYEAKVCLANPKARNVVGARPTVAAAALGEACATTLFAHGLDAGKAVCENRVDDALEQVVEANTLLSGVGFESGGLAAAHGLAGALTSIAAVEKNYLHGEMVAAGVMMQLMLQQEKSEAKRVAEFFAAVGLPVTLAQIGMQRSDVGDLRQIAQETADYMFISNLPFDVSAGMVYAAVLAADELGSEVTESVGDTAYRRVQN
ncbi:MAG: glycerol dehydrogenase [Pseudomonadaceae bacterium]|nr:glycerol dehydrogenase [Pseudomonadaceae bacterium]